MDVILNFLMDNLFFIFIFIILFDSIGIKILSAVVHNCQTSDTLKTYGEVEIEVRKFLSKFFNFFILSLFLFIGWTIYDMEQKSYNVNVDYVANELEEDYNFDCGSNPNHKSCQ